MDYKSKSIRLLGVIFISVGILLSTHLGEFWPFSIYPMFSTAGNPWERAIVRDVSNFPDNEIWQTVQHRDDLPGNTFALNEIGINQNDVSNFLSKIEIWDERSIRGLRHLFRNELSDRDLVLMSVVGSFTENRDSVIITYTPLMLMKSDTTIFNETLDIRR